MKRFLKNSLIPHEGNNYAPHSLQKTALLGMVGLVILSFTIANLQSVLWVSSEWLVSTILPSVIVDLTNGEREDQTLGILTRNTTLDEAASLKAQHMADGEYFSHYSPEGVSPWYWFGEVSYNFVHAGENLAIHFTDSSEVVDAWMDSPTHRANILSGNYTEIGVGTAVGTYEGFNTIYVVQLFGTPAAQASVAGESAETEESSSESELAQTQDSEDEDEILAESVALTETVEIIEAEPEPVFSTSTPTPPKLEEIPETEVADVAVTQKRVSLYSSLISTSTGAVPATIDSHTGSVQKSDTVPYVLEAATQPHLILQLLYALLGAFVLVALVLSIFIEIKRQQPLQIAYSMALLLLMYGLFKAHLFISSGALIV